MHLTSPPLAIANPASRPSSLVGPSVIPAPWTGLSPRGGRSEKSVLTNGDDHQTADGVLLLTAADCRRIAPAAGRRRQNGASAPLILQQLVVGVGGSDGAVADPACIRASSMFKLPLTWRTGIR